LEQHFIDLMNYQFTAKLEDDLDGVAEGAVDWQKMLTDFWVGFEPNIESAKEADRIQMLTGKPCPKC
jgi:DNA topoisomerase-1